MSFCSLTVSEVETLPELEVYAGYTTVICFDRLTVPILQTLIAAL